MNGSSGIREKLHTYIDTADDVKVQALYLLLENEIDHAYTDEDMAVFIQRRQRHLDGLSTSYTVPQAIEAIRKKAG